MSADDIKAWETKAKIGLVRKDNDLYNMLGKMRNAFFDEVKEAGINLSKIGIDTSIDYTQRGKLFIDETKLKSALQNNGDALVKLFTRSSATNYIPGGDNSARYKDEGIMQRINDILKDYTGTIGKKGILLQKAGIKGDFTEFQNLISKQLKDKNKIIDDLSSKLSDRENKFYIQFSKLEKAMQQSNSQSSWLSQQLGRG